MSSDKFDDAKRLHEESVEKFKAAHNESERLLEKTDSVEERTAIRAEYIQKELEAIEEAKEATRLQQEAIDEVKPPAGQGEPGEGTKGDV